jgi:hypothetical protein
MVTELNPTETARRQRAFAAATLLAAGLAKAVERRSRGRGL